MADNSTKKGQLGVVYTPDAVAKSLTAYVLAMLPQTPALVLEPSVGDGSFLKALEAQGIPANAITAIDIDENSTEKLTTEHPTTTIICQDFLTFALSSEERSFELIIGNPPFIRGSHFSEDFTSSLDLIAEKYQYPRSEIKNAWAAFVLASAGLLTPNGTLAMIVPYELLNVSYGKYLQTNLLTKFRYLEILVPKAKAFQGIEQDAVVFLASNHPNLPDSKSIKLVTSLEQPGTGKCRELQLDGSKNQSVELKSGLLDGSTSELLHKIRLTSKTMSDFCTSRAGIVTAANDYFILSTEEVDEHRLWPWARPILKKGSYLGNDLEYTQRYFEDHADIYKCHLIDFGSDGQPPLSPDALDYIAHGKALALDKRYKMLSREPWYKIPIVQPSAGLFFKRSHRLPRLTTNASGILATDTAYVVTPKSDCKMPSLVFSFYNIVTILFAEIDGRFYGGGVLELTPSEFKNLPVHYKNPTNRQMAELSSNFSSCAGNPSHLLKSHCLWIKTAMKFTDEQMEMLFAAYQTLQEHRLRHGSKSS